MKKLGIVIGLLVICLTVFITCKKDPEVNIEEFEIATEELTVGPTSASIVGTYSYPGKVAGIKAFVADNESFAHAKSFEADLEGTTFTIEITDLKVATTYHYYYSIDYGFTKPFKTEAKTFATSADSPTVRTLEVMPLDTTTVRVKCEVVSGGGQEVTERGICWNTYGDPTMDDETVKHANNGTGQYTLRMENLSFSTKYYVRAYAKNDSGVGFGEVLEFETSAAVILPEVSTVEVTNVTSTAALCVGNVASDGGGELVECGVCWSLNANPSVAGSHAAASEAALGVFQVTMTDLTPNKTYHVRAYAANAKGTSYGDDLTFTTTEGLPVVTTSGITEITATTAKGGGEVTDQGASNVTERGICWGTSHNPTISTSHANNGTGAGVFTVNMTGLTPNATYYVRAYATNGQGTSYGAEVGFTAMEGLPVVQTQNVSNITSTTASGHGKVTNQGGSAVSERGICWSTEPSPSISGNHASSGTGTGEYTVNMTNLTPGTKYYVRAYATNDQGTSYGEQKDFTTAANLPTVVTGSINGTTVSGEVTNSGGATVTERGICWNTSHNPTISGAHGSSGTGTGTFSVELTDLAPGTTYYVRAYAINSAGTAYGSEKSLTTDANLPTVTTGDVYNIAQTTALGSGNVTNDGGATVTERGVCWSTSHNPTISGSHAYNGTGTGSFTVSMTGLTANTHYYVRAYAKNSAGVQYGNEVDFTTALNVSAPTVTTSQVTNITQTTATGGGNVTNSGGATVTERGICWSTSHNPTTSGSHASSGTGTGSFSVNMTGLSSNTTYYVRAYAINSAGTSYGIEVSFTTQQTQSYTVNVSASPSTGGAVSGGGTYQQGQSCTVSATAATGYTFIRWTENGNQVSTNANYTITVTGNRTLVAQFQIQSYTIAASANPTAGGTVTGGGSFNYGQSCTLTATANSGYTFANWTENGNQVSTNSNYTFTVNGNRTLVANFIYNGGGGNAPTGAINGLFTINANGDQVYFSQGNLQFQASTNTWRLAENQWDYVGGTYFSGTPHTFGNVEGSDNSNISPTYDGWIDLFGWGTSGWNNGNVFYQPWDNDLNGGIPGRGYGPTDGTNYEYGLIGIYSHADWGVHNSINNATGQWRVLTGGNDGEWNYILNARITTSGFRYAKAQVNNVDGLILLPDDWNTSYFSLSNANMEDSSYNSNVIDASQWIALEQQGAVFLPAAGERWRTDLGGEDFGNYWATTCSDSEGADIASFSPWQVFCTWHNREMGFSVRLVQDYQP